MVENQTYLFIVFSLTGIGLGVLFDFFRALRKTFKTPDLVTYLEDIIYYSPLLSKFPFFLFEFN